MGSHGYRRLQRWKSGFVALLDVWEYSEFIGQRLGLEESRGAHNGGGHALPPGRAFRPCGHLVALLTSCPSLLVVFWSKKNICEGFIPFRLRLVLLFCETQKQGKNRNWNWALDQYVSPKNSIKSCQKYMKVVEYWNGTIKNY